jgi:hypothetical protein
LLILAIGCTSEHAPAIAPNVPVADASAAADVAIETAAPTASIESDAAVPPIGPSLWPEIPRALAERLAREADAIPNGVMNKSPPHDAERDRAITKRFGERCRLERTCGPLWGVDCEAAVDGPYFYVRPRPDGLQTITTCGGACMGGRCKNCPPKNEGWTCETY